MKLKKVFLIVAIIANLIYAQGKLSGGVAHSMPSYFKDSFLDISEDVAEAAKNNKHLMIFVDLSGCPYCAKMLKESFESEPIKSYIIKHFDVIHISMNGNREVTWDEDTIYTEREFVRKLKIYFSPTIFFLDGDKNIVARVNGYRSPQDFLNILKFVSGKYYKKYSLEEYLQTLNKKNIYKFRQNSIFKKITDLSKIKTPLMVIFEDNSCSLCDFYHDKIFSNQEVKKEMKKFTIVRFDANSNKSIITPEGKKSTPKEWVKELDFDFRPGILLYNDGELISKVDALLFSFHLKELFRYVSRKYYEKYNGYLTYLKIRQKELLKKGVDINISK